MNRSAPRMLLVAMVLSGCSDPIGGSNAAPDSVAPDPAIVSDSNLPDPAVDYDSNGNPVATDTGYVQVDANTATSAQLIEAFQSNGIGQPDTWAAEVIDHRPYATGDLSGSAFDDLRAGLAEAGLDDLAIEAVVASLTA